MRAGNELLEIKGSNHLSGIVRVIEDEKPKSEVRTVASLDNQMEKLLTVIMKLTEGLNSRHTEGGRPRVAPSHSRPRPEGPIKC